MKNTIIYISLTYIIARIVTHSNEKATTLALIMGILLTAKVILQQHLVTSKDNFHFEVTPEKMCDGGWYMWTSNPRKMAYCSSLPEAQRTMYTCSEQGIPGLYMGRPLWYENTPLSDDKWENPIKCNEPNNGEPSVL